MARRPLGRSLAFVLGALAAMLAAACRPEPPAVGASASDGLVYVHAVDGSAEVLRVRISDGEVRSVTSTPDREERWPYWSDGAQRLVFQVGQRGLPRASDLVLWDPETGSETKLTSTPRREDRWPAWSPDGRFLVYAFLGGRPPSGVARLDLRENASALIARSGPNDFFLRPTFSPDGRLLVAQRRIPDVQGSNLWILSPGARPRRLTSDPDWFDMKAWYTRDGSRIVYTRRPVSGGPHEIVVLAAGGGGLRTIVGSEANAHSARPSPTRDEIAFVSDRDGSSDVFVADLDGGSVRNLRPTPDREEMTPRWSPDGERLVVTTVPVEDAKAGSAAASAVEHGRLVVLDRDGNELLETMGAMPDWMPPWR